MIALSHGGTTSYSSKTASNALIVGTADGVVILNRSGTGHWAVTHQALRGVHISSLVVLSPDVIFAGAFHDTVYASTDNGITWSRKGSGIEPANVYSLLGVQCNGNCRILAGTQPAHLFFSDDLGLNWQELFALRAVPSVSRWSFPAPPHEAHVKHIVADPRNSSILFACIEQGALLKSSDSGDSWQEVHGIDDDVHFLSIDPRDSRRMYASSGVGCYSTSDGGSNWKRITTPAHPVGGYPDTLVRLPSNPDVMYLGSAREGPATWRKSRVSDSRLCRSLDAGLTWEFPDTFPSGLVASIQALAVEDNGQSVSLYLGSTDGEVRASENGGLSWEVIASGLAPISKFGLDRALQGI